MQVYLLHQSSQESIFFRVIFKSSSSEANNERTSSSRCSSFSMLIMEIVRTLLNLHFSNISCTWGLNSTSYSRNKPKTLNALFWCAIVASQQRHYTKIVTENLECCLLLYRQYSPLSARIFQEKKRNFLFLLLCLPFPSFFSFPYFFLPIPFFFLFVLLQLIFNPLPPFFHFSCSSFLFFGHFIVANLNCGPLDSHSLIALGALQRISQKQEHRLDTVLVHLSDRLPIRPIQVYDHPFACTTFWREIPLVQIFLSINMPRLELF